MSALRFDWDESKNRQNIKKHGITFEEAQTVFLDDHAIRFYDPDHSKDEDRFLLLGLSFKLRILVVCHCYRESEAVIRIISARKATRQEAKSYGR
ncbi:MAG: BrnT family toxin [Nitrospira sp. CR2.1]|nr:BrnT family toxin [Nitrospira sp. CR2.1]